MADTAKPSNTLFKLENRLYRPVGLQEKERGEKREVFRDIPGAYITIEKRWSG